MLTHNPDNNLVGGCNKHPGQSFLNCYYCMLDNNLVGQEPKKEVKFKQRKNEWIAVEDYKPDKRHLLFLFDGKKWWIEKVGEIIIMSSHTFKRYLKLRKVKRVMILSRK